ncbi:response regulator transcription factor [Thorsellia anophelis]|nr:response regulator transcription factor [Thorsellia anophelis]
MKIILVEDNLDLGEAIESRLRFAGHSVDWCQSGLEASLHLANEICDILILDINLPGKDGFAVLKEFRASGKTSPVLVITARSEIEDKVSLLDIGADDYLVKPFDLRELDARLRALCRRQAVTKTAELSLGNVIIDQAARTLKINDSLIDISKREFRLLEILSTKIGQVIVRERLMSQLFNLDEDVSFNALELHISRLRKKLEPADITIVTVRGVGYAARFK